MSNINTYTLSKNKIMNIRGLIKEVVSALAIALMIAVIGHTLTGAWPFMVAVQSGSMEPHLNIGDVVFLVSPDRTQIITWVEGKMINYKSFGDYGDVIVYYPNGDRSKTPIIHRVIAWVNEGDRIPILENGRLVYSNVVAKTAGYITQGDNNPYPDQLAVLPETNEVILPVNKSWIIGVAKFKIPYVGYLRLLIPI